MKQIQGIFAAAVTPFDESGTPSSDQLISHLRHLETKGCTGVLVCGTTGEGQSLTVRERLMLFDAAKKAGTRLTLLAGTGAASLEDAIELTRGAFDRGCDAVVVIPPFFMRNVSDEGLLAFYSSLINRAIPADGQVLLYHNPVVASVGISNQLIQQLRDQYPDQVIGIKDSSSDWNHTSKLLEDFPGFQVLVGDDRLVSQTFAAGGAGAITGLSNLFADLLVDVMTGSEAHQDVAAAQERVDNAHRQFNGLPRIQSFKALLQAGKVIQHALVRPPLCPMTDAEKELLSSRFHLDTTLEKALAVRDSAR